MSVSVADCRVLIVDDNEFNRKSLALVLRKAGITNVDFAVDGRNGLEKVAAFRPDLVLLDVAMPTMDGLEMCRTVRQDPALAELPILFQTAHDSDEEQVQCFDAGGSDFISKPIKPGECVARVRHHLEKRKLFNDLVAFRARLERELRHAQAMQLSLLPENEKLAAIGRRHGLSIRSHFETSSELGGDLWMVFELDPSRVAFLILDFAGHGITAAINTFRLHTLVDRVAASREDPGSWLAALSQLLKDVLPVGQFATAFYALLDRNTDTLTYAAAGSPPPLLGLPDGSLTALPSSGFPLGVSRRPVYPNQTTDMPPGSFLFLYSDALVECTGFTETALGYEGVERLVQEATSRSEPLDWMMERFFARTPRPLRDDLTTIWLRRLERPAAEPL